MPGVPTEFAEHSLHVKPDARPVKQPLRRFGEEKRRAIGEEIARLLDAGFIMEVYHPDWRSEEHTSELQSLRRISYAVFCLKKKFF